MVVTPQGEDVKRSKTLDKWNYVKKLVLEDPWYSQGLLLKG